MPCASQARAYVLCAKRLQRCCPRRLPARDPGAMQHQTNTFLIFHIALFSPHTPHFILALHLNSSHLSSSHLISCLPIHMSAKFFVAIFMSSGAQLNLSHLTEANLNSSRLEAQMHLHRRVFTKYSVLQSLHKARPSTTLYCKPCTKYLPVLLCTTKLAQSTFQYYFARQSLHKVLPSTTLYYKACTKSLPVLLCTTKLAQSSTGKYFVQALSCKVVLESALCKLCSTKHPSTTTLYYTACTKHFPVLLCTAKLAQSTSQCYFVLQNLHKILPSI